VPGIGVSLLTTTNSRSLDWTVASPVVPSRSMVGAVLLSASEEVSVVELVSVSETEREPVSDETASEEAAEVLGVSSPFLPTSAISTKTAAATMATAVITQIANSVLRRFFLFRFSFGYWGCCPFCAIVSTPLSTGFHFRWIQNHRTIFSAKMQNEIL
jgi:hypothetical protein